MCGNAVIAGHGCVPTPLRSGEQASGGVEDGDPWRGVCIALVPSCWTRASRSWQSDDHPGGVRRAAMKIAVTLATTRANRKPRSMGVNQGALPGVELAD